MKKFLDLIEQAAADNGLQAGTSTPAGAPAVTEPKKPGGGLLGKVVGGVSKAVDVIQKGEQIALGNWDISKALQLVLDKQLDKSTNKLGLFGKKGYTGIKLGEDLVRRINLHTPSTDVDQPDSSDVAESDVQESFNGTFLKTIREEVANITDTKGSKSKVQQVWEILVDVLGIETEMKLTHPKTGKKIIDRRVSMISKGIARFLKSIEETYPDIGFAYDSADQAPSTAAAAEQEEEFNFMNTTPSDWVKSLGEENAKKIVQGLMPVYPDQNIRFNKSDQAEGDITPDQVVLTADNAIFELTTPTSFGAKGTQYTLKPASDDIAQVLKDRNIAFLTYLLQTPANDFKVPESNTGIIYAYDDQNEPINSITTKDVNFQWNGQAKIYSLSTSNKELMGIKYSEGEYPLNKSDVLVMTDGQSLLYRKDEQSGYIKFPIKQKLPSTDQLLVDFKKGKPATDNEVKEGMANNNTSPPAGVA